MTLRLAGMALDLWPDIDGYAVGHNVPPLDQMPLERMENFIWWWITKDADQQAKTKFKAQLWRPPPNERGPIDPRSPWSAENERAAFEGLKAALSGRPNSGGVS